MAARSLLSVLLLLVACAPDGRPTASPPASSTPAASTPAASGSESGIVAEPARIAMCSAEPCGGDASLLRVYRDDKGVVKKLYRLYGGCFHSPGIYFDPDGKQTEIFPERPIAPGSEEARALEARHKAQIGGLAFTDVIRCKDGSRSAP